jgi:hypothetical protein
LFNFSALKSLSRTKNCNIQNTISKKKIEILKPYFFFGHLSSIDSTSQNQTLFFMSLFYPPDFNIPVPRFVGVVGDYNMPFAFFLKSRIFDELA